MLLIQLRLGPETVKNAKIPFKRPYAILYEELAIVKKYIDELKSKGVIRKSTSKYISLVLLVRKPGGRIRVYINYRVVNAIIVKNRYPLLYIRETLVRIYRAKIFSVLDIIIAFNRLYIREGDE